MGEKKGCQNERPCYGLCRRCFRRQIASVDTSFSYQGLQVAVPGDFSLCSECLKEQWINTFARHGKELVAKFPKEKHLIINWLPYIDANDTVEAAYSINGWTKKTIMGYILESLGILSHKAEGNWEIVVRTRTQTDLNPKSCNWFKFYFARKSDAREFAKLNYPDVDLEIRRAVPEKERVAVK